MQNQKKIKIEGDKKNRFVDEQGKSNDCKN